MKPLSLYNRSILFSLLLLIPVTLGGSGCSGKRTVTRTEVVEDPAYGADYGTPRRQVTTTETVEHEDDYCDGVLSCTFDVLGTIIAFPFKVVAKTFEIIFS